MKMLSRFLCLSLFGAMALHAAEPAPAAAPGGRKPGEYFNGPDSKPQPGVPKGRLEGPFEFKSKVYEGTVRLYWIWVPAQYNAAKPAALLVFQDGQRAANPDPAMPLQIPQVMENLIHKKEMPVTIGLFITPGNRSETFPDTMGFANPKNNPSNRANEYDAVNDTYARFLLEEMIPEVKKKYNITDNPEGRLIGGTSSGAICAFNVAFNHTDQFRKVITAIGSFTSIGYRPATATTPAIPGGETYPTLVRRAGPKPIRIFMQDGTNDLDNNYGNWHLANEQMVAAINFANNNPGRGGGAGRGARGGAPGAAGAAAPAAPATPAAPVKYDLKYEWGDGEHSDVHLGSLLPDVMRWMWRDYPKE